MTKRLSLIFIILCVTVCLLGARTQMPSNFKEESPVTVEPPALLSDKGSFTLAVQIPSFSYNFAGIDFYALHDTAGIETFRMSSPLPSTAVSFTWSPDDRFSFGGKVRFAMERYAPEFCPVPGRRSVLCADLFATAGILSTPLSFDNGNCIMLLEGSLLLGASWRTNYDWSTVCPSLGLSAGVHLGREFITMAFGVEATAALDVIGPVDERTVMFSLRPNISLAWRWL